MSSNTTKNTVWVGILIPTYERTHFLEKSLASAVSQTYRELEIVVVDNGQTEGARNLVADLNDSRVQYIRNEQNIYLTGSICKGMQLFSRAVSWSTILPDDDLLDLDFIKFMVDYVKCHPAASVVHGHKILINAEGEMTGETSLPPEYETAIEYLVNRSLFIRQTFLAGVFFCRKTYNEIGGYPKFTTGMATDDALIFGLSLRKGLFFNKQAIASVRMYPEAESHDSLNVIGHIRAFENFGNYISKMSIINNTFSCSDLKLIHRSLDNYTRASIGGLWLRGVHKLLFEDFSSSHQRLSAFYELVMEKDIPFPLRVRVDVFFARVFHWNPEVSKWYRYFCNQLHFRLIRRKQKLWQRAFLPAPAPRGGENVA